jgi:hypothetical protein
MTNQISTPRAFAGFGSGAAVALAIFVFLAWPVWQPVLLVGAGIGLLLILIFGLPLFMWLRAKKMLNIIFAIVFGGLFSVAVPAGIAVFNTLIGSAPTAGYFILALNMFRLFFLPGALGGLVGWLVAAGWRFRAT